jgi:formate dehydrogenase major subunit
MFFMGHAPNSQTRLPDLKKALERLDLLVIADPYPTLSSVLADRTDNVYLLPAASTMEIPGSVTNSQRAIQWRERVVEPVFEAKSDYEIVYRLARKLGFADELFRNISIEDGEPVPEDLTREFNAGMWTVGYTGQSPERIKRHMQHQDKFDTVTSRGQSGPVEGEYYGLPWPCWGPPEMGHPGTPILYDTSKPVSEGGLGFRARWGVERKGENLLAEGSYPRGSEIEDGHPELTFAMLQKLGWAEDLRPEEMETIRRIGGEDPGKVNWKTDLSGGIQRVAIAHGVAPFGNGKARAVVWNFPDAVPIHREPLYTPRRDLVDDYPTYDDRRQYRLPVLYRSIQDHDFSQEFPLILTTGRLVEYEGGGDETRSCKWLAELQQRMFAEIHPKDAAAIDVEDEDDIWLHTPEGARVRVAAMITHRVGPGTVFMPFHFGGQWMGDSLADRYPPGTVPWVLGESANTAGTYGYDVVTFMQESKGTLCRIAKA